MICHEGNLDLGALCMRSCGSYNVSDVLVATITFRKQTLPTLFGQSSFLLGSLSFMFFYFTIVIVSLLSHSKWLQAFDGPQPTVVEIHFVSATLSNEALPEEPQARSCHPDSPLLVPRGKTYPPRFRIRSILCWHVSLPLVRQVSKETPVIPNCRRSMQEIW